MRFPSKFRYFWQRIGNTFCNIPWIKIYFYNIKTLLMNCFQNWKEQSVRFFFLHFFIDFLFSVPWWVRQRVPETEPLPESQRYPVPDSYIASYRILPGWSLRINHSASPPFLYAEMPRVMPLLLLRHVWPEDAESDINLSCPFLRIVE